jgi:hypothetical protein
MSKPSTVIFVVGLRRSGTTIFWETLRQDERFRCYDEPFNPKLALLPQPHPKQTWDEFIDLYNGDPQQFKAHFSPIRPEDEPSEQLDATQCDYLRWLIETAPRTLFDFTRCHFKLRELRDVAPDGVLVHLYRDPRAVASSHLLPSGQGSFRRQIADAYRKVSFFRRRGHYNGWQFQQIIEHAADEPLAHHFRAARLDPVDILTLPAAGKLMAYWKACFDYVERWGPSCFGERFVSMSFERFSRSPCQELHRVYQAATLPPPATLDISRIKPAKPGYRSSDPRWQILSSRIGIAPRLDV